MKHIISLGAGVQSSTMALMAAHGEIEPMPDCAIFADTGAELDATYDYLDYLTPLLPFPVHIVDNGSLTDALFNAIDTGERMDNPPFRTPNGSLLSRKCTQKYKVQPLRRKQREIAGLKKGERCNEVRVTSWQGISLDEIQRARISIDKWCEYRYPLIEMRLSRDDCTLWLQRNDYKQPPRSACVYCPYRNNHEWRSLRDDYPHEWAMAARIDNLIRPGLNGTSQELYLHRSAVPLLEVDLSTAEDHGQQDMFAEECEGMCGL